MRLDGRVAVVTGAAGGIGRCTAETFAREGAAVAIFDLNRDGAQQAADGIAASGGRALAAAVDVTDRTAVDEAVRDVIERFGTVDILVNDAGAWGGIGNFLEVDPNLWANSMDVCFFGTLNCSRAVLGEMTARGYGRIVNVLSDAARTGEARMGPYAAAKAAVAAFSKSLALEVGRSGITVNCVSPGHTKTEQNKALRERYSEEKLSRPYPVGRLGEPQDQANAILFFASDESSWITGQILSVSGGYTMVD